MYQLIQNLQIGLQAMGLQSKTLIDYIQSFFGNVPLQFSLTAISSPFYQVIIVHERILFFFNYSGTKIEGHMLALREMGKIDETLDGGSYTVTIYDSGLQPFYSANTSHIDLTKSYRNLVNILIVGMR